MTGKEKLSIVLSALSLFISSTLTVFGVYLQYFKAENSLLVSVPAVKLVQEAVDIDVVVINTGDRQVAVNQPVVWLDAEPVTPAEHEIVNLSPNEIRVFRVQLGQEILESTRQLSAKGSDKSAIRLGVAVDTFDFSGRYGRVALTAGELELRRDSRGSTLLTYREQAKAHIRSLAELRPPESGR